MALSITRIRQFEIQIKKIMGRGHSPSHKFLWAALDLAPRLQVLDQSLAMRNHSRLVAAMQD